MSYFFEDPMETEIKKLLEKEGYNVDVYINQDDTFNNNQYEIQVDSLNVENWNDFIFYIKKILYTYEKERVYKFVLTYELNGKTKTRENIFVVKTQQ